MVLYGTQLKRPACLRFFFITGELDRRQNPRWELFSPCRIIWQKTTYSGRILDLSQRGAMVESSTLLPHGQQVTIFFSLAGRERQIGGTVIHRFEEASHTQPNFEGLHGFYVEFHESQKEIMAKMQNLQNTSSAGSVGQPLSYELSRRMPKQLLHKLSEINKDIWLVLAR